MQEYNVKEFNLQEQVQALMQHTSLAKPEVANSERKSLNQVNL